MKLRPIDDCDFGQALAVLKRGFPEKSESFWAAGLQKILTSPSRRGAEPVGFLMAMGGEDVGIVLTIPSGRSGRGGAQDMINLAAWYVDEKHRWLAPRMLQKVVAQEAVFTDLTPSLAAQAINQRLGFEILNEGFQVFPLPWTALRPRRRARVISVDAASLSNESRATLDQHARLGCVVAVLQDGAEHHPLIFSRLTRRHLPGARVILTDSKRLIVDNLAVVSRFLLRNGLFFLMMDANRADARAGIGIARWSAPTYVKGATDRNRIDHTYSELIFLG
ncbi:hypothetical protein [Bradyrhizobium sp.]|uniref:hypothetical protein n=1 Tax=Bradyrhizobium sp. TaxID=376 RepID=UPI002733C3E7|nr:hypothetical protein [Bradyrhizobium sp.]MDP3692780.1 hypothetical protein [Bradyrhizobium sp.]